MDLKELNRDESHISKDPNLKRARLPAAESLHAITNQTRDPLSNKDARMTAQFT
jgi:hypothetical protein